MCGLQGPQGGGVTRPGDGLESRNKVNLAIRGDVEGQPCELCR